MGTMLINFKRQAVLNEFFKMEHYCFDAKDNVYRKKYKYQKFTIKTISIVRLITKFSIV